MNSSNTKVEVLLFNINRSGINFVKKYAAKEATADECDVFCDIGIQLVAALEPSAALGQILHHKGIEVWQMLYGIIENRMNHEPKPKCINFGRVYAIAAKIHEAFQHPDL
jgi:hypothetical protein